jgi:hypothetical protein
VSYVGCAPAPLDDALDLFRCFHRFAAPRIVRARVPRRPRVLVQIGALRGVIYTAEKDRSGGRRTYIHFMDDPPLLACSPCGTQLHIVGGTYRVTPRGIVG